MMIAQIILNKNKMIIFFILLCISVTADSKQVIGWIEKGSILEAGITLHAKIDTGADTTSLSAKNYEIINKMGEQWVRFTVNTRDGDSAIFEKKLVKHIKIKRKAHVSQKRPVVNMTICIGDIYKNINVNLTDRSNFKYQLLIGRHFLKGSFIIDPSVQYTVEPQCKFVEDTGQPKNE